MSTRKRLLIISAFHIIFLMLFVIFITISSRNWLENIQLGLQVTYSLIFPCFMIIVGIATRLLSTKPIAFIYSLVLSLLNMCCTLLIFNIAYSKEAIEAINGMNSRLSIIEDIGPTYVLYAMAYFVGLYFIVTLTQVIIRFFKTRSIIKRLSERDRKQTKIDNPMYLKSYNKVTNRYEKYLIWQTAKGKIMASDKIIYFDKVELLAVDSQRNIYAMLEMPERISLREYIELKSTSKQ